ncbi:MAG: deoxyribonuclease IV [Thermodesulfobacteriota bacterium]
MPLLGAHMSISGGLDQAVARIRRVEGQALQIFTRNQRQWRAAPLSEDEVRAFRAARRAWGEQYPVAAHNSYLVNLAAADPALAEKSGAAMLDELERCGRLAIPYLIIHPGAHTGQGIDRGLARVAANLDRIFSAAPEYNETMILLETTAGQGSSLGSSFEELARIIDLCRHPARLGVCFDTCHAFAAGHDLATASGYDRTFTHFDRVIGLDRLRFFHLNDSLQPLGSRRDRHAHIGKGHIGAAGFALLVNDPRFAGHPMVLETPKEEDLREDTVNLEMLRALQTADNPPR